MAVTSMGPRPFGIVLSDGMSTLAAVFTKLISPALGAFIPMGALSLLVIQATGATEFFRLVLNDPTGLDGVAGLELESLMRSALAALTILLGLQVIASVFVAAVGHRLAAAHTAGVDLAVAQAVALALRRLGPLLLATVVAAVAILAGLVLFVVPGIALAGFLTMVVPVMALENLPVVDALRRSYRLVRGRWWPTVGFVTLVGVAGTLAGQAVQLVALPALAVGAGRGLAAAAVLGTVVQGLIVAAISVMITSWYLDLRARGET